MKSLMFGIALAISSAAIAQTQPETPPAAGAAVAAGNQTPERDARGIPVVSEPATAPAGANQPFSVPQGAQVVLNPQAQVFTPQPAAGELPPCSRTVTDRCTQTYERGRAPRN
jgi:hypothetical protein